MGRQKIERRCALLVKCWLIFQCQYLEKHGNCQICPEEACSELIPGFCEVKKEGEKKTIIKGLRLAGKMYWSKFCSTPRSTISIEILLDFHLRGLLLSLLVLHFLSGGVMTPPQPGVISLILFSTPDIIVLNKNPCYVQFVFVVFHREGGSTTYEILMYLRKHCGWWQASLSKELPDTVSHHTYKSLTPTMQHT